MNAIQSPRSKRRSNLSSYEKVSKKELVNVTAKMPAFIFAEIFFRS